MALAETRVNDIIAVPIKNSRSFMGEPPVENLKEFHPGATGSLGFERLESEPFKKALVKSWI